MLHYAMCNNCPAACVVPQECTMKVQEGKFKLQDLLVVPMQRVLKYHLLLKVGGIPQLQNLQYSQKVKRRKQLIYQSRACDLY